MVLWLYKTLQEWSDDGRNPLEEHKIFLGFSLFSQVRVERERLSDGREIVYHILFQIILWSTQSLRLYSIRLFSSLLYVINCRHVMFAKSFKHTKVI